MFLFRRSLSLMIIVVIIYGLSIAFSVKADSNTIETKVGWTGIGAFGVAIKDDGTVWTWGGSATPTKLTSDGDIDEATIIKVPTLVKGISNVKSVASGQGFTLALKNDGTVWSWGVNRNGQLGDGTQTLADPVTYKTVLNQDKYTPVQVKNLTDVVAIAADWGTSFAVKKDGTLWAWGIMYRKADGDIGYLIVPTQLHNYSDIVSVSLGWGNMVALKKDGTVWYSREGEAAQIDGISDIKQVAAGGQYSYGVKNDGTVWFWGANGYTEAMVGGKAMSDQTPPQKLEGIKDAIAIKATAGGPLILKSDGTVWTLGDNVGGQLGIGTYEDSDVPIQVKGLTKIIDIAASGTAFSSMAIKEDHTLWSWGNGYVGDGTKWYRTVPVMIKSYDSQILQDVNTIKVDLNGNELVFDQPPVLINNRTMVPLRKIFEALGATINWDQATSTVTATKGEIVVKLTIGSNIGYVNGKEVSLDAAAVVLNARTLVPVRFIGSSFGAKVTWDEITKSVVIKTE
jgi:alpha-tubulin suppressor-like RCC1 family protein